jgi:hypothetical protein
VKSIPSVHHAGSSDFVSPPQPCIQPTDTIVPGRPSRAAARDVSSQWRICRALFHDGGIDMCGSLRMSNMNPGTSL